MTSTPFIAAIGKAGARFSVTVAMNKHVQAAIDTIPEAARHGCAAGHPPLTCASRASAPAGTDVGPGQ